MRASDYVGLVRLLTASLGPTLVSTLAGSKDTRAATAWEELDGPRPNDEQMKRLQCAVTVWRTVSDAEGDQVARLWFVGANPFLRDGDTVIAAIREDRFDEVASAAQALVNDSFSG